MAIRKILVPVDYSEHSQHALTAAVAFARMSGAEIEILHVWDRPSYVPETLTVRHPDGSTHSLIEMIRENAESEMMDFVARANLPAELRVERRLAGGDPAAAIVEELERGHHDLVVIGTHGRTGFRHLLLGSVAEKLVRLSPVPVLTVPRRR